MSKPSIALSPNMELCLYERDRPLPFSRAKLTDPTGWIDLVTGVFRRDVKFTCTEGGFYRPDAVVFLDVDGNEAGRLNTIPDCGWPRRIEEGEEVCIPVVLTP